MFKLPVLLVICLLILNKTVKCRKGPNVRQPNIVVIMADDLGSHDISLRGSNEILTPNIDALGYQGVILNRHYTAAMCTPSRAALLTGKYPIHTGMQHYVLLVDEPRGLPLNEKILPEYLKEVGYKTHIVGKWHLGIARKAFTPTYRGFDSHLGYLGPYIDYFDYTFRADFAPYAPGFDFRRNESVYRDRVGEYATDVLSDEASKIIYDHDPSEGPLFLYVPQLAPHAANYDDPLQALPEDLEKVQHIEDPTRRSYAAMVKGLDRSVGQVVDALRRKNMLANTIILFFSDNGGPTVGINALRASNYPLRGQKDSPWEGGLRGPALVWSPLLQNRHYVSNHLTHITDWLPTFARAAGVTSHRFQKLDGNDIWNTLSCNKSPIRREMVHNINPIAGYSSFYRDGWKYINGTTLNGRYDDWLGNMTFKDSPEAFLYPQLVMKSDVWRALNPFAKKHLKAKDLEVMRRKSKIICQNKIPPSRDCDPLKAPCLFYVENDPCEVSNLAHFRPIRMEIMERRIQYFQMTSLPPNNLPSDPNADPGLNDYLWTWWLEKQCSS